MEERKRLPDYLAEIFIVFGVTLAVIAVMCAAVGDEAREASTMFELGKRGIPLHTVAEYFFSSVCVTILRIVFFSDVLFRRRSVAKRTVGMLASVIALIGLCAYHFGWFPVDEPECWGIFLVCFGICFAVSAAASTIKERLENKKLESGLQSLKEKKYENMD